MKSKMGISLYICLSMILASCSNSERVTNLLKEHNAKLEGRWRVTKFVTGGEVLPTDEIDDEYFFFKDGMAWPGKKEDTEGDPKKRNVSFELDPTKNPATIVLIMKKKDTEDRAFGIYKFEDNKLILCVGDRPSASKPTEFKTTKGNYDHLLMELVKE